MTLVVQLYGGDGEIQDPAVGWLLEGELAVKWDCVEMHAPAVQLLSLLVLQGVLVQAIPLQLLIGVVVSAAAQGHLLLLQGTLRWMNVHAEALRDGFVDTERGEVKWLASLARQSFFNVI